jgi:hypothetical protein
MPITVKRISDGKEHKFADFDDHTRVHDVKKRLREEFAPKFENGCRLTYAGHVLKSIHRLKHYNIPNNGTVEMHDTKNWSSSSSSSDEEKRH